MMSDKVFVPVNITGMPAMDATSSSPFNPFIYETRSTVSIKPICPIFLKLKIEEIEEGTYLATSTDMPDLLAQGKTIEETKEIAQDVVIKLIESYIEHGDPLPQGINITDGKIEVFFDFNKA